MLRPINDNISNSFKFLRGQLRNSRQLDPLVKIVGIAAGFGRRYFFVNNVSAGIDFADDDTFVQDSGPFTDIQKSVRLLMGDDLMQLVAVLNLFIVIILLSDFNDKIIGFLVFETDKI